MLSVAITGKRTCRLQEVPDPSIREDFALVKVLSAPLCTEYKAYMEGQAGDCLGHEAAGEVVAVAQPGKVKPGDRVVVMPQHPCGKCALCQSGDYIHCEDGVDPLQICHSPTGKATYAQYLIKQDWLLLPIPEDIPTDHAAMACCGLGPTFGAMQRMNVTGYDSVLVVGLGPVGLGAVINGVFRGARVIGADPNPYRRHLAQELGACAAVDTADPQALQQVRTFGGGRGVDKAIDCTAVPSAQRLAIDATRRRGQVAFVGWGGHVEQGNMIPEGRTLHGIWHWNLNDAFLMFQLIRRSASQLERMITHRFPMSQIADAWELQARGECGKVIVHPWEK